LAVPTTLAGFAYEFEWLYSKAYVWTDHMTESLNPYLRPAHTGPVLTVTGIHEYRLTMNGDHKLTTIVKGPPGFKLTPHGCPRGAAQFERQYIKADDDWFHRWLEQSIYGGQLLWQLTREARYAGLLVLALTCRSQSAKRSGRRVRGATEDASGALMSSAVRNSTVAILACRGFAGAPPAAPASGTLQHG
jgi:hypothetical protein